MKILGIDPGIATTGYGLIEKRGNNLHAVDYGAIITTPKDPMPKRLHQLGAELEQLIQTYQPDVVALEALFFNKNVKTALIVGQARGVMLYVIERAGILSYSYTPPEVKMGVCGYGRADKKQVQHMVKALLNLSQTPKPDDVADALAIAICHSHAHKLKSLQ